jgi:hypothetical protein
LHQPVSANVVWHESEVPRAERGGAAGVRGATVWFTGLSGSGKSTVASAVAALLTERGVLSYTLDGDNLRHGLNGDLGFSADDRAENVRRVGEVARLFADAGVIALVPLISPYRVGRDHARALHDAAVAPMASELPTSAATDSAPSAVFLSFTSPSWCRGKYQGPVSLGSPPGAATSSAGWISASPPRWCSTLPGS